MKTKARRNRNKLSYACTYEPLEPRRVLNADPGITDPGFFVEWDRLVNEIDSGAEIRVTEMDRAGNVRTYPISDLIGNRPILDSNQSGPVRSSFERQEDPGKIEDSIDEPGLNAIFGADSRTQVSRANVTSYPYRTNGQLKFSAGSCSAALISSFHVLTAAHCVTTAGGSFFTDWEFEAGKDGDGYRFYGVADWNTVRYFSSYAPSGNYDFDMALITLDRNLGSVGTGWLAYGYNSSNAWYTGQNAQNIGFPGDKPFGTMWQSVANPTSHSITTNQLRSNTMDTWFGNSGGPIHYSDVVHGVVSHFTYTDTNGNGNWDAGEPPIYNGATRMTQTKFDTIGSWIAADASPTDLADLVSWDKWFDSTNFDTASASDNTINVDSVIRNMGTAAAGSFTVRYRLSTDQNYDVSDIFLGDSTVTSLSPFNWTWNSLSASIPGSAVDGQPYYVVYTIDVNNTVSEFTNAETGVQNTGVVLTPLIIDRNDQISEATFFTGTTIGSIDFATDVRMYSFFATAGSVIQVDTDMPGSSLDTVARLFNSAGTEIAFSDDSVGPVPEYTIRESYFEFTILTPGTYYVGISAYSNWGYNPTTGNGDINGGTTGTYQLHLDYADSDDQISESTFVSVGTTVNGNTNFGADVDMYRFSAIAGQWLDLDVDLPGSPFDSVLRLFDSAGNQIAVSDDNVGPGTEHSGLESYLRFIAPANGIYYLAVSVYSNFSYDPNTGRNDSSGSAFGNYQLHVLQAPATLLNRQVYYKGATIPGGFSDHLDTSKVIAKQGATAQVLTFSNVINHSRGINGMVFDYDGLPAETLINSDFIFQWSPQGSFDATLPANQPANWALAPNPTLIDNSALSGNSRRIRLEWTDNTIVNRWLRVTIKANTWTGLTSPETFYLGHLTGDVDGTIGGVSGTLPNGRFSVSNLGDVSPVRTALGQTGLGANSLVDINKSGGVTNLGDVSPVRSNLGAQLTVITMPAGVAPHFGGSSGAEGRSSGNFGGFILGTGDSSGKSEDRNRERTTVPSSGKPNMGRIDETIAALEPDLAGNMIDFSFLDDSTSGKKKTILNDWLTDSSNFAIPGEILLEV